MAFSLISRVQTQCEVQALQIGSTLADYYNSFDEATEWDVRMHNDFLVEHLGFAGWIQSGLWGTSNKKSPHGLTVLRENAFDLQKRGGWVGLNDIQSSSYWALDNKWVYMMGDSTVRQVWAAFVSSFNSNDFEKNAKEWTREQCAKQFPHRKEHPPNDYFPEEGWGGRCGNNEVTCHLGGFGHDGKITFDWKHFTYEDYDQWLFGSHGVWSVSANNTRYPDVLSIQFGLHTCEHGHGNATMLRQHEEDLPLFFDVVRKAISRVLPHQTIVIFVTSGRTGHPGELMDNCIRRFNRLATKAAHLHGFPVLEREEIERRLLFKSEAVSEIENIKFKLHLQNPAPQIIGTAMLGLISCLTWNQTIIPNSPFDLFNISKLKTMST